MTTTANLTAQDFSAQQFADLAATWANDDYIVPRNITPVAVSFAVRLEINDRGARTVEYYATGVAADDRLTAIKRQMPWAIVYRTTNA